MDTDLWLRAKAILGDVADLAPEERAARIATASDGDAALQKEVERLLALDDEAGSYFGALRGTLNTEDAAPAQIGVYRIVGESGRGGKTGSASCRERVSHYVYISAGAGYLKKIRTNNISRKHTL